MLERLVGIRPQLEGGLRPRGDRALRDLARHVQVALLDAHRAGQLAARVQSAAAALGGRWADWGDQVQNRTFDHLLAQRDLAAVWANLTERGRLPADGTRQRLLHRDRAEVFVHLGMLDAAAIELQAARPDSAADDPKWYLLEVDRLLMAEAFELALAQVVRLQRDHGSLFADPEARNRLRLAAANALHRLARPGEAEIRLREVQADTEAPETYRERATAALATMALDAGRTNAAQELLEPWLDVPLGSRLLDTRLVVARHQLDLAEHGVLGREVAVSWQAALQDEFATMSSHWRAVPPQPGGMAFLQLGVRRDLLRQLWRALLLADPDHGPERCLQVYLEAEALGSAARRHDLPAGTTAAVRQLLVPPHGVLLVYLPAPQGSAALAVTAAAIRAFALPGDIGLRVAVRNLRELLADDRAGSAAELEAAAAAVAGRVLPPALRTVIEQHDQVAIAGCELLSRLPFEALPWPTVGSPWLGLCRAVAYLPSLPLMLRSASAQAGRTQQFDVALVAAGAAAAPDRPQWRRPPLPLDGAALRDLAAALATGRCAIHPGSGREGLRLLAAARIAVLFAHGITDPDFPHGTGVLLAGDERTTGAVFAYDLDDLAVATSLLVLCSCATGRTSILRGDSGMDFGSAWLFRGAKAVIQADDDLMLAPTRRLVAALLEEIAQGLGPAEALRRARCRLFAGGGPLSDRLFPLLHLDGLGFTPLEFEAAPRTSRPALPGVPLTALLLVLALLLWPQLRAARRQRHHLP